MIRRLVSEAETSGITTKRIIESRRVLQGIAIPLTPRRKVTMGI